MAEGNISCEKSLLAAVSEDMTRDLLPTQLGVRTKRGCDAILHTIRQKHDNDEKRWL